jgi:putative membrane protein insertion efficiency factor
MGHCDSSAQLGRDGGIFGVAGGAIEGDAAERAHAHSCGCDRSDGQVQGAQLKLAATESKPLARSASRWLLLAFVRFYKIFFSPFLGGACKFYPSCSNYAQEAIALHGARRGAWLAMKRLGRCRPFTRGGFDPVPDAEEMEPAWLRSVGHLQRDIDSKEQAQ